MKHLVQSSEGVDTSNEMAASDKVELSSQAHDIQRAREVAQDAPEVRMDKVEAARRALQSGNLNLNGQDLAEKLLKDARTKSRNA
jgi:negative regulator of flagellin synthesis FlgM